MTLHRLSFEHSELEKLPVVERSFFTLIAHIRNDIRHLNLLTITASNSVRVAEENIAVIALHHYEHALRMLSATLFEAWEVFRTCWDGKGIGQERHKELQPNAQSALKSIRRYFENNENNIRRIRNSVVYHYDSDSPTDYLSQEPADSVHQILTGDTNQNTFHLFAEAPMKLALFGIKSDDDMEVAERKMREVGDDMLSVTEMFSAFTDNYLILTTKKFIYQTERIEVSDGIDPRSCPTIVIAADPSTAA